MFESLQPPGWTKPSGYANGIAARGKMIFVAGQIGWNEHASSSPTIWWIRSARP
jgi:enamine deaminase RidA (YjgF/YER057c/UK114 family)